jgi:hypothetical protein
MAFVRDAQVYERMSESFRFDDGYAFTPAADPLAGLRTRVGPGPWWVALPLLVLVGAILYKAARLFLRPDWARY